MNFEENDKPFIKAINSNIIRAEQSEDSITKIQYGTEVVKDAMSFSNILKKRGDYKHSFEYVNTALNVNRLITNMIQSEQEHVYAKRIEEEVR